MFSIYFLYIVLYIFIPEISVISFIVVTPIIRTPPSHGQRRERGGGWERQEGGTTLNRNKRRDLNGKNMLGWGAVEMSGFGPSCLWFISHRCGLFRAVILNTLVSAVRVKLIPRNELAGWVFDQ